MCVYDRKFFQQKWNAALQSADATVLNPKAYKIMFKIIWFGKVENNQCCVCPAILYYNKNKNNQPHSIQFVLLQNPAQNHACPLPVSRLNVMNMLYYELKTNKYPKVLCLLD